MGYTVHGVVSFHECLLMKKGVEFFMNILRKPIIAIGLVTLSIVSCGRGDHLQSFLSDTSNPIIRLDLETYNVSNSPDTAGTFEVDLDTAKLLRVIAIYQDGIHEAYRGNIKWSSDNTNIKIESDGLITALKEGESQISATSEDLNLKTEVKVKSISKPRTVFFRAPSNWSRAHIWFWYLDGYADPSGVDELGNAWNPVHSSGFGTWPGPAMRQVKDAERWFTFDMPRYDSPVFSGYNLVKQPTRIIFSNGQGEKTKMFLRKGGCLFPSTAPILNDQNEQVITGNWKSEEDCEFTRANEFKVWASSSGGPFWDSAATIEFGANGDAIVARKYTTNGTPASEPNGIDFAAGKNTIRIGENLPVGQSARLCLYARNSSNQTRSECFTYTKAESPNVNRLGARFNENGTTFSMWSPDHGNVFLWLGGKTIPMGYLGDKINGYTDVYSVTVPGNHHLQPYHFIVNGKIVRDPYAVMATPGTDFNIVINLPETDPSDGWVSTPELKEREDAIIYEISVRDFTSNPSSGVSEKNRGKFLGLVEKGTKLIENGEPYSTIKTGLEHLKELGITHVQLLPIFDFGTCSVKDQSYRNGCYNWGYDPENYNTPEEMYAIAGPTRYVERIRELKTMINELHRAGIRVVMDVVYNHTWTRGWQEQDEGERYLSQITTQYFVKQDDTILDITGTGNALDTRRPMVSRMIRDSLEYWAKEYHIDGFRFDLAGVFDYEVVAEWSRYLNSQPDISRNLLLYGEPWTGANDPYAANHIRLATLSKMRDAHFGAFNHRFREAIKGGNNEGNPGYAFNNITPMGIVINGVMGSRINSNDQIDEINSIFANDPEQTINYASAHDNLTLWDKVDLWGRNSGAGVDYRKRIDMLSNAIVLTSQGIPMIHGGEEILRTKGGSNNSFRSPDSINGLDWKWKRSYIDVFDFYRHAIAVRRAHPGLRLNTSKEIRDNVSVASFDQGKGLMAINIRSTPKTKEELIVIYNSGAPIDYYLPDGEWKVAMRNGAPVLDEPSVNSKIWVDGTAVTIVYRNQ